MFVRKTFSIVKTEGSNTLVICIYVKDRQMNLCDKLLQNFLCFLADF